MAGSLDAAGAIRQPFLIICGMETAFFGVLTMSLAYYHKLWKLGVWGGAFSSLLPYFMNLLWIRFSNRSLIYPAVALVLFGPVFVEMVHRKISGPRLEGDAERRNHPTNDGGV